MVGSAPALTGNLTSTSVCLECGGASGADGDDNSPISLEKRDDNSPVSLEKRGGSCNCASCACGGGAGGSGGTGGGFMNPGDPNDPRPCDATRTGANKCGRKFGEV